MRLQAAAHVTLAVKNGPPGMWRALGAPGRIEPVDRFVTSPLWLAGTVCVCLTLAPSVYRAARGRQIPPTWALLLTSAALGLVSVVDLLARHTALPLLVFVALVAAAVTLTLRAGSQPPHHEARRPAEVVDLARRRKDRGTGGHGGPR